MTTFKVEDVVFNGTERVIVADIDPVGVLAGLGCFRNYLDSLGWGLGLRLYFD